MIFLSDAMKMIEFIVLAVGLAVLCVRCCEVSRSEDGLWPSKESIGIDHRPH